MKTAEEIIQEYLERGYGLESLRILAESREELLGGQMLEVIGRMENAAPTEISAAEETPAAGAESAMAEVDCDEAVFFVADDDGAADGESVDFDLMAETLTEAAGEAPEPVEAAEVDAIPEEEIPAALEESVADIVIGETDGTDVVSYKTEEVEAVDPMDEPVPEVSESAETGMWSRLWSRMGQATPALAPSFAAFEEEPEAVMEEVAEENETVEEFVVAGEPVLEEEEPVLEEPTAEEFVAEEPVVEEPETPAASAEISADYMPGSVIETMEEEQTEPVAESAEVAEIPEVAEIEEEAQPEAVAEEEQPEVVEEVAEEAVEQPVESKVSRREKRRRDRLEKKKARRGKKIVAAETEVEAEEKPASSVMPDTLTALSALSDHSFAFVASLSAMSQSAIAQAAESIEQDRLAEQAIEQNNFEAALENEEIEERDENEVVEENEIVEENEVVEEMEEAGEEEASEESSGESSGDNVIHFRDTFSVFAGEEEQEAEEESDSFESPLHMLAAPESESEAVEEPESELASEPESESASVAESLEFALAREAELRRQLEEEYQTRLDTFAARLLDVQAAAAASENRVAEKRAELDARTAVLEEMKNRLEGEEEKQRELLRKLDESAAALQTKDGELAESAKTHEGLREEHSRLYAEFEDLRKAYNEVVTDVLPGLQSERDDLAMTVERQCARESSLRTRLNSSRKRLAAGYILGAAACLMLVTLPVANWLRSGDEDKKLAVDRQLFSELRETLDVQVRQNVDAQTRIVELERKITRARDEISRLDGRNKELAGLAAAQHSQGIAVFKPGEDSSSGTPTRAMTMALQATVPPGGKLHVNEVMDPAGSIEQLAMANSERYPGPAGLPGRAPDAQMAQAATGAGAALPVSALVRTDGGSGSGASGTLRPQAQGKTQVKMQVRPQPASDVATVTAKVKKGEGVAQVVYRVLNTRDPDVIAWVIAENKIRSDRRGNPLIQPNQELRLPRDGRIGQAASAAGVKRR